MYVNCTRSALWLHIKIFTMLCYRISGHSTQSTAKRFGKMSFYKRSLIFSHLIAVIGILTVCTKETVIEVLTLMRPLLLPCSFV